MYDYQEVCPISKAASVLCERWTLQILREMFFGVTRFSEFQTYLPKLSPTLLNARLRTLVDQGIIVRRRIPEKRGYEYQLTPAGKSIEPVLREMGKWGMSWAFSTMDRTQLNLSAIVRDFAKALNMDQLPGGDLTIQFNVAVDEGTVRKFVLLRDGHAQVCEDNIGHEVNIYLSASLDTLAKIWFGEYSVATARERGLLKAVGDALLVRNLGKWLGTSQFGPLNRNAC